MAVLEGKAVLYQLVQMAHFVPNCTTGSTWYTSYRLFVWSHSVNHWDRNVDSTSRFNRLSNCVQPTRESMHLGLLISQVFIGCFWSKSKHLELLVHLSFCWFKLMALMLSRFNQQQQQAGSRLVQDVCHIGVKPSVKCETCAKLAFLWLLAFGRVCQLRCLDTFGKLVAI